eukprot:TRINITY_DN12268_c0_g2_i1.p1 TRINITY_DN12268_c0_g2~~TRINITY_DN12268_c0_g2_i1.p1  ORF type:complete len:225 (-),score=32.05 TRINITY_DN12268_c0_g2_i1:251-925(-)
MPEFNLPCMEGNYPGVHNMRMYIGNMSTKLNMPDYTITRTDEDRVGRPMPRTVSAADHLGPGYYPVDRDFPGPYRSEEHGIGWLTRSANSRKFIFPIEDREEAMMRRYRGPGNPGPGTYHDKNLGAEKGARSQELVQPSWTVPRDRVVQGRPQPRSITAADHLGPGQHKLSDYFEGKGWKRTIVLEKAAKKLKDKDATWSGTQYGNIFRRSAGTGASAPSLVKH